MPRSRPRPSCPAGSRRRPNPGVPPPGLALDGPEDALRVVLAVASDPPAPETVALAARRGASRPHVLRLRGRRHRGAGRPTRSVARAARRPGARPRRRRPRHVPARRHGRTRARRRAHVLHGAGRSRQSGRRPRRLVRTRPGSGGVAGGAVRRVLALALGVTVVTAPRSFTSWLGPSLESRAVPHSRPGIRRGGWCPVPCLERFGAGGRWSGGGRAPRARRAAGDRRSPAPRSRASSSRLGTGSAPRSMARARRGSSRS